jgi:hypothetical protein
MENNVKVDLQTLEPGLKLIEMAYVNGLSLVPNGKEVKIRRDLGAENYNKEQAQLIVQILARNQQELLAITANQDQARDVLARAQKRMVDAQEWLLTHLDLWDRLEQAYRKLFPEDTGCVRGEQGCMDDAVVRCRACVREGPYGE